MHILVIVFTFLVVAGLAARMHPPSLIDSDHWLFPSNDEMELTSNLLCVSARSYMHHDMGKLNSLKALKTFLLALGGFMPIAKRRSDRAALDWRNTRYRAVLEKITSQNLSFESTGKKVSIAMFDFDQTLSREHVFNTLSGFPSQNSNESNAVSPAGQISKLVENPERYNALWAFGGEERISALRNMLERLKNREVKMMICTLGYPAVVKRLLEEAGLLKYFGWDGMPGVVGMFGEAYRDVWTSYDEQAAMETTIQEKPNEILQVPKVILLEKLLRIEGKRMNMELPLSAGVLVEDDPEAIWEAQHYLRDPGIGQLARTDRMSYVQVIDRKGMQENVEMTKLLVIADA